MRRRTFPLPPCARAVALAVVLTGLGCGSGGSDYYFIWQIAGENDTLSLGFAYTCGQIDIGWNGSFGAPPNYRFELTINHDDGGADCDESPRDVAYDIGPIKRSFREVHPDAPLGLRIPAYEEEQGAMCLADVFSGAPFEGRLCR